LLCGLAAYLCAASSSAFVQRVASDTGDEDVVEDDVLAYAAYK